MELLILLSKGLTITLNILKGFFRSPLFISFGFLLFLTIVFFIIPGKDRLYIDEYTHYPQVISILKGETRLDPRLTTLPGYHLILAMVAFVFHNAGVSFLRYFSIVLAFLCVFFFHKISLITNEKIEIRRLMLFGFFPLFFPYYFLIYTDIFSLLLFLMSLYFGLKKQYQLSAILGILNLLVRQNTFFWYLFIYLFVLISHYPVVNAATFRGYLKRSWVFLLGLIFFSFFVIINKGVAIGDKEMHPGYGIHLENIFFFSALTGLFVFPIKVREIFQHKFMTTDYIIIFASFAIYFFSFSVTHPYNNFTDGFFLRNVILRFINNNDLFRIVFFIPISAGIMLFINFYRENKKVSFLFSVLGALSLIPSWLIEQRYYFVHFTLLFLFAFSDGLPKYSKYIILIYALMAVFLTAGIFNSCFFL